VDERQTIMKKLLGVAAFVLLFSIPAHAQAKGGASAGMSATNSGANAGVSGGGTSSGGGIGGGNGSGRLPTYPRASFDVVAVSGGDPSFAPSTFLSFDQAVAEGKAMAAANEKSLGQIATENSAVAKAKAKLAFVQDANGDVVLAARQ
jgi:hypothetical protein